MSAKKGWFLIAAVFGCALAVRPSYADTIPIDDPLHGFCFQAGACADNGTNTPIKSFTQFGFDISPGPQTGDYLVDFLVPNNTLNAASLVLKVSGTQGGVNNTSAIPLTNATLVSTTAWTSGTLAQYIPGMSGASPNNGIGAYLPATQVLDPGATGFFVYQADLGTNKLVDTGSCQTAATCGPLLTLTGTLADGSYAVGFLNSTTTNKLVATANSGALFGNNSGKTVLVPEPPVATLFVAGLLGLGLLRRRRRAT
jgi:hypothetical protein